MSSYTSNTSEINSTPSQASTSASASTLPSAFNRMMGSSRTAATSFVRDQCTRPTPKYNSNYNPYELPPEDLELNYSPYALGEPLHDNRLPFSSMLPSQHTLADASKRRRTSWVWHFGYALKNNSIPNSPTIWACKLCIVLSSLWESFTNFFVGHHDIAFRHNKTYTFYTNTLNNVEKHLKEVYILDQGGDI